jgi:uncharacterized protein YdaU (DUF1376 family)
MITETYAPRGGMTFTKFFPSDWRTGCLVLNLEEEGLYIRLCMFHYDTGKALPDDYPKAANLLNVHVNKFRKVMDSLISKGKVIRAQGILFNERVQEEIDKYRMEHVARSKAARDREDARRAIQLANAVEAEIERRRKSTPTPTPLATPALTPPVGARVSPPVHNGPPPQSTPPNPLKSLNAGSTAVAQGDHSSGTNLESRIQKLEEERKNTTTGVESDAARSGGDYLDILNGTAVDLLAFIGKYAGGIIEEAEARRMLSSNIRVYGPDAMMEAYTITVAEMAGGVIPKPYKYLIGTAQKIKDSRVARTAKAAGTPKESTRESIRRFAEQAEAKLKREGHRV